ncbi:MAG: electron transfer flavoprotein subunit beta [Microbacterium sp.]|uniref:electron transfer flavoprotein subunit beta/FixA family protein n=1 Tax=Microbacterium sp. TaxID=51671 RepID=UPI000DB52C86|nr:electron transfer flavoprotein subunit beta/FixA family protein [Microbacterium sp.]PZU38909.1 MAG: electron transfer flavoprotein subunit beta [Microbacterium sp.]
MRIIVLVKEVPDTYGERTLSLETGLAERDRGETVLDEIGERALEAALAYAESTDGATVSVMSMGRASAVTALRKALAMGAHDAVLVADDALQGADLGLTARVLAAALRRTGFDLVVTGNLSTDGSGGVLPAMLAELLAVPHATALTTLAIAGDRVSGDRVDDEGVARVSAPLPAVISITEALPDPRFPTFKGIMAAKKKPFETWTAADLGVDTSGVDLPASIVVSVTEKPPRQAGLTIVDEGDAGERLAEFLVENRLV